MEIPGGLGFPKTKKFKEMYEVELEFPEGWGALIKNPFRAGGMDILWNYTMKQNLHVININFRKVMPLCCLPQINVNFQICFNSMELVFRFS